VLLSAAPPPLRSTATLLKLPRSTSADVSTGRYDGTD
jgi:hypothetical protein